MEDGKDLSEKSTTDVLSECRGVLFGDDPANTENADMYVMLKSKVEDRLKVACTSGPFFEKNYQAVPHIFFTNNILSDWSKS